MAEKDLWDAVTSIRQELKEVSATAHESLARVVKHEEVCDEKNKTVATSLARIEVKQDELNNANQQAIGRREIVVALLGSGAISAIIAALI